MAKDEMHRDPLWDLTMEQHILEPGAVAEFTRLERLIWNDLVEAHTNLVLIEKRREYPARLLRGSDRLFGWYDYHLFLMTIIVVHRVQNDQGDDTVTLPYLKGYAIQNTRPENRDAFQARFKTSKHSAEERGALEKLGNYRDNRVAHRLQRVDLKDAEAETGLSLKEMRTALEALRKLYHAIRVGVSAHFKLDSTVQQAGYTLDLLVINSDWSTRFDEDRAAWERSFRGMLSADELAALNQIRARHDLPEIPTEPARD